MSRSRPASGAARTKLTIATKINPNLDSHRTKIREDIRRSTNQAALKSEETIPAQIWAQLIPLPNRGLESTIGRTMESELDRLHNLVAFKIKDLIDQL